MCVPQCKIPICCGMCVGRWWLAIVVWKSHAIESMVLFPSPGRSGCKHPGWDTGGFGRHPVDACIHFHQAKETSTSTLCRRAVHIELVVDDTSSFLSVANSHNNNNEQFMQYINLKLLWPGCRLPQGHMRSHVKMGIVSSHMVSYLLLIVIAYLRSTTKELQHFETIKT